MTSSALAVALGALLLAGCNVQERIAEEVVGQAVEADIDVDPDDGSVTVETSEGTVEVSGSRDSLPEHFPEQFPVPEGLEIGSANRVELADGVEHFRVIGTSTQAFEELATWVEDQVIANGWTIDSDKDVAVGDIASRSLSVTGHGFTGTVAVHRDSAEGATGSGLQIVLQTAAEEA